MNEINHQDWNQLAATFSSAQFPSICIDNFLSQDFVLEVARAYPEFETARTLGREFAKVNEKGKIQVTDHAQFPQAVKRLASALSSKAFIENLESLTGIQNLVWDPNFSGGGMHLTRPSGYLDVHVDFNYEQNLNLYRRVNLLLYLNEQWDETWGGELELWDEQVKSCFMQVSPELNKCVVFETSEISYHGVTAVQCPEHVTRNSFAVYYYTEQPPPGWSGENHTTVFKARPDEKVKKYISMPLQAARDSWVGEKIDNLRRRLSRSE